MPKMPTCSLLLNQKQIRASYIPLANRHTLPFDQCFLVIHQSNQYKPTRKLTLCPGPV